VYVFGGQFKGENMSKYLDKFQNGVNNERNSPGALSLVLDFSSPDLFTHFRPPLTAPGSPGMCVT